MNVVADTGPINYLVIVGQTSLLPRLFETVCISATVRRELAHPDAPSSVREWIRSPPRWLSVHSVEAGLERGLEMLGSGERESISLALSLSAKPVLMDDRAGVSNARSRGLEVTGTLGVLQRGAERGLLNLADVFDHLRKTSFRVRAELLEQILARHIAGPLK